LIGSHSPPPPLVAFSGPSAIRGDDDVGGTGVTCVGVTVDPGVGGDGDFGLGGADEACAGGTNDAGASGERCCPSSGCTLDLRQEKAPAI
jgi:hypothetical protein